MPSVITKYTHVLQLIEEIVKEDQSPSTVIICSSRDEFLEQLSYSVENQASLQLDNRRRHEIPSSQDSEQDLETSSTYAAAHDNPLLKATLQVLAVSERIQLAFCPTIPNLRAYLSVFPDHCTQQMQAQSKFQKITIVNLLALHHGTTEFTVQGMMRTLASVASLTQRTQTDLGLVECKDVFDLTNPDRGSGLWDTPVRLLSGSIKLGEGGSRWAGQTVTLRKIASRWFTFE